MIVATKWERKRAGSGRPAGRQAFTGGTGKTQPPHGGVSTAFHWRITGGGQPRPSFSPRYAKGFCDAMQRAHLHITITHTPLYEELALNEYAKIGCSIVHLSFVTYRT